MKLALVFFTEQLQFLLYLEDYQIDLISDIVRWNSTFQKNPEDV